MLKTLKVFLGLKSNVSQGSRSQSRLFPLDFLSSDIFHCIRENLKARVTAAPRTASKFSVEAIVRDGGKLKSRPLS